MKNLVETWKREEQQPFSGWDFSYLDGRMIEDQPPWDYALRAAESMKHAKSVVDIGTGGGERFLSLKEFWPPKVTVTEDYPPNFKLAVERLAPLGVRVVNCDYNTPFADEEFDLVLNRHTAINARDVFRILTPGGVFLTEQVHGLWAYDLLAAFDAKPQWPEATPENYIHQLQELGMTIVNMQDWTGCFSFTDVGAIVYYLKAIPWLVPGFSVETHLEQLFTLQSRLERGKELVFKNKLYLIEAHIDSITKTIK
ncbi:class I SAM-dependent methyltransferase [Candidatus Sumerlaeota bacterium]|nr:class I SAM-dependent methyltransferase [Candidatus Sumerlaeota bacterium]